MTSINTLNKIATADCETDPFLYGRFPKPFVWGFYWKGEFHEFDNTVDFVNHVKDLDIIVYAHNGGKFDWFFVLEEFSPHEKVKIIGGRLAEFKIGKCRFRDSYNILPVPLSSLAKDDFDYTILEADVRDLPENKVKISAYLKSDCVNLHDSVYRFVEEYGMALTLAGAAMNMQTKISGEAKVQTNQSFFNKFSKFYFGGRTQAFKKGQFETEAGFKYIDLNSAYPAVMSQLDHPWGKKTHLTNELPEVDDPACFIELRCESNGHFPLKADDGSLNFPDDNVVRTFFITGHEYYAARDLGLLRQVSITTCRTFNEKRNFSAYVGHFFAKKLEAEENKDKVARQFAKLFLNSLYGKYASNPDNYSEHKFVHDDDIDVFESKAENQIYGQTSRIGSNAIFSRPLVENERKFVNVATAASITGAVRAVMMRALCTVDTPYYCDTDSIVCDSCGDLDLDPHALGAWDTEAEPKKIAVIGKKMYAFKMKDGSTKVSSKGVRLTYNEMIRVAEGKTVKYCSPAPTYSVKAGSRFITRRTSIETMHTEKTYEISQSEENINFY